MKKVKRITEMSFAELKSTLRECDATVNGLSDLGKKNTSWYKLARRAQEAIREELSNR
jgi:hypothetical protein